MNKINLTAFAVATITLSACTGGSSSNPTPTPTYPAIPTNKLPDGYTCLPSAYPSLKVTKANNAKIAYGSNCMVSNVTDNTIKSTLSSMAVALTHQNGRRYCTGTPLSYDANTKTGFILTAAHCVIGEPKPANTKITANNITTFSEGLGYINQINNAATNSGTTGNIDAVYVPNTYCEIPAFSYDLKNKYYFCGDLTEQYSDFAVIKVHSDTPLQLNSQIKLASSNLQLTSPSYLMALGYGKTNDDANNTNLFYITYEYFGTNSYSGETGVSTIMNGYSPNGSDGYYSIICGGDSGGGDFYWDGSNWQLVAVHSYGSAECGALSNNYSSAFDASGDIRPFANNITQLINNDSTKSGCNNVVASANGFVCKAN